MNPTTRLYWDDDHLLQTQATVVDVRDRLIAFDRTCFYPGGGGQPPDQGTIRTAGGEMIEVLSVNADAENIIWHECDMAVPPATGETATLMVNAERRYALARYHTALHVLNTIVLRDYNGWITGAQIATDYSRIDFKLEGISQEMRSEIEAKVNDVLEQNHILIAYSVAEEEFRLRTDLLRTLEAEPPVHNGKVRVVEIKDFDAQACGGTHVSTLSEVGRFSIYKIENKGKLNKRFYVRLELPL